MCRCNSPLESSKKVLRFSSWTWSRCQWRRRGSRETFSLSTLNRIPLVRVSRLYVPNSRPFTHINAGLLALSCELVDGHRPPVIRELK